jgi:hypothetical protein
MLDLFRQHNFDQELKRCDSVITMSDQHFVLGAIKAHPDTIRIQEKKFRIRRRTIAVIIYYTHFDGTMETKSESIRMLLIKGVKHEAEQLPPK